MRKLSLSTLSLMCLPFAAHAEPATPEGAKAIEQSYAAYLTAEVTQKGLVTVTPDGDSYRVRWDLQKIADSGGDASDALTIEPLEYRLTPQANGGWTLRSDHFPRISFHHSTEKDNSAASLDLSGYSLESVYDPTQTEFLRSKASADKVTSDLQTADGGKSGDVKNEQQSMRFETRARNASGGPGVDVALAEAFAGMTQNVAAPPEGASVGSYVYSNGGGAGEALLTGLRAKEMADLWKFAVAHMSDQEMPADFKTRVATILPLWDNLKIGLRAVDFRFDSPAGGATMKSLTQDLALTGLVADGQAEFGLAFDDLEVNSPMAPAWASSLFPASIDLHLHFSDHGWDEAARLALADANFGREGDLTPETQSKIEEKLMAGDPKLRVPPGRLKLPTIDLTFEGEAALAGGLPAGHAKLTADSLDKTLALLQEINKTEPQTESAILSLTLMKGLAKTGDDGRLVWEVDITGNGAINVNGTPLSQP